jgi:hypothetical protein
MRLSSITALGIAAFLGIMAVDPPDANAQVRGRTVVSSPRGTAVISRRPGRVTVVKRPRHLAMRGWRWRGARGAVICRTVIVNGVRVRRCR